MLGTGVNAGQGGFLVDKPTNANTLLDHQTIQIAGTPTLDGVYPIASISTDGTTVTVTAAPATSAQNVEGQGTVGNPVFTCPTSTMANAPTVTLPVYWGPNFELEWEDVIDGAKTLLDGDPSYGYFRFGMGTGGENSPIKPLTPTCESVLDSLSFSVETVPWSSYDANPATWESDVAHTWLGFEQTMLDHIKSEQFTTTVLVSLSTIDYDPGQIDYDTADAEAGEIAAESDANLGMGNQGWREADGTTVQSDMCAADYCALFDMYKARFPLELQTVLASDPANSANPTGTGNLAQMFAPAIGRGVKILEIYADDYLCAFDPSFNGDTNASPKYVSTYAQCTSATYGFPAAFMAAATSLD